MGTAITIVMLLALPAGAVETVPLNASVDVLSVEVLDPTVGGTVIEYELGSFTTDTVEIGGRTYATVVMGGESRTLVKGLPALPTVNRSIIIPDDAEMELRVVESHYVDFEGIDIAPSKGSIPRTVDPSTVAYEFDAFYETDGWYPESIVHSRSPYIMRDVRGMVVTLNPFRYNPGTRTLRVYDRVVVEAVRTGPGRVNVLSRRHPGGLERGFVDIYERHFLNFDGRSLLRYTSLGEMGTMLIISYGDFMDAMQPYVDWKLQMGVPVEMVDVATVGATSTAIKSYIQDYYDSYGVTFVLLVGDGAQVPTPYANGGSSDPTYALVAGADTYPDLIVGRFSAETVPQVDTQVERSVEYEKTPLSGGDWYHKGMGIASTQGPGDDNEDDDEHADFIRDDLLAFTYTEVDQIYGVTANAAMVTDALNDGRSIVNYTGHGSSMGWSTSGFLSSHVNALTNDNMLPFIWSVACVNGMFDGLTCFAEVWLRATNGSEPTGAVATYMSSINQDWDEPMDGQDEMVDLMVSGAKRTFGALAFNGSCHMLDEYGLNGEDDFLAWHIFGDPSLRVRTDTPVPLAVVHADNADPLSPTFDVTVTDVEGALCALYYDGVLYGSALTGPDGTASIEIDGVLPTEQDVVVTVTSFNGIPYFGTVRVGEAHTPIIDVSPSSFATTLEPGQVAADTLFIENAGEPQSVLHYSVEVLDAGMMRTVDASGMSVTPTSCEPGTTFDLVFELSNDRPDDEWFDGAVLHFPDGVTVNSCTDFVVADRRFACDGAAGDGASVAWEGDWWNVVYPGESATATVNVTVEAGYLGGVEVVYGVSGDGYGDPPHSVSGTVVVDGATEPILELTAPNGDEVWGIGETHDVTWNPSGGPLYVDILCSVDGGASWVTIAAGTEDDGEYAWEVDVHVSDDCLLRVCMSHDDSVGDISDSSFSIYQPVDWLTVSPTSGDVTVGSRASVSILFDTTSMSDGDYFADIVVTSNGGDPVVVPVSLYVNATGVDDRVPGSPVLYGSYPNPARPTTKIAFSLPSTTSVRITVHTVDGRLVRVVDDDLYGAGRHSVPWDGRTGDGADVPNGVYLIRVEAGTTVLTGKSIVIR